MKAQIHYQGSNVDLQVADDTKVPDLIDSAVRHFRAYGFNPVGPFSLEPTSEDNPVRLCFILRTA